MTITNTTSWAPSIPTEVIDRLVLDALRASIVLTGMVRQVDLRGKPGLKYDFNSFDALTAAAKTQGTPYTPAALGITEDGTVTASEVGIAVHISEIAREASPDITDEDIARQLGSAIADKLETDTQSKFSSGGTGGGTTGVALAITDFEDALLALRQAKAPTAVQPNSNLPPALAGYFSVVSESGASQLMRSARQTGVALASPSMTDMLETFGAKAANAARFSYLGVRVYGSDLVPTSGGDRIGAILCPAAIGVVTKRPPQVKLDPYVLDTATYHVGSTVYGVGLIKTVFCKQLLHLA